VSFLGTRPGIDIDGQTVDVATLDEREVHSQRDRVRERLTNLRALLNLQISGAIQHETTRLGGTERVTDGVEVIAAVAGVPQAEIWKILASDFRPSMATWARIERILTLCQATQAPKNVVTARQRFEEIVELSRQLDLLNNRAIEIARRRRGIELFKDSAPAPPNSWTPAADTSSGAEENQAPPAGSQSNVTAYECERCGAVSGTKSRRGACPRCGFRMVSTVVELPNSAGLSAEPSLDPRLSTAPAAIPDLRGHDRRPDPLLATTQHDFVAAMRAYRVWAGEPSLRVMEERCGNKISYSTFRNMLNATAVPKLSSLQVFVEVLGGTADDIQRWTTAWRRFAMQEGRPAEQANDGGKVVRITRAHSSGHDGRPSAIPDHRQK
jgi:DNA-directed RNA polymerase subunit RPC12/RpoP